ncbi:unnamed protein product, partial [marine sediment metagenome]
MKEKKEVSEKGKGELALRHYIDVALEEYRTLRNESRQCSVNMFTALYIGLAIIGIILAVGLPLLIEETIIIGLLILYLFVPTLAIGVAFLVLGEAVRFKRVGDYICFIEAKLTLLFKESYGVKIENWDSWQREIEKALLLTHIPIDISNPLAWERWLRGAPKESFLNNLRDSLLCLRHLKDWAQLLACLKVQFPLTGHLGWVYGIRIGIFAIISIFSWGVAVT